MNLELTKDDIVPLNKQQIAARYTTAGKQPPSENET